MDWQLLINYLAVAVIGFSTGFAVRLRIYTKLDRELERLHKQKIEGTNMIYNGIIERIELMNKFNEAVQSENYEEAEDIKKKLKELGVEINYFKS